MGWLVFTAVLFGMIIAQTQDAIPVSVDHTVTVRPDRPGYPIAHWEKLRNVKTK